MLKALISVLGVGWVVAMAGCSTPTEDKWVETHCDVDNAYTVGRQTAYRKASLDSAEYQAHCGGRKDEVIAAYREGYEDGIRRMQPKDAVGSAGSLTHTWHCLISVFGQNYESYAATELDSRRIAEKKCNAKNDSILCEGSAICARTDSN